MLKSRPPSILAHKKTTWHPSASLETLRKRAFITKTIRDFFAAREIMEVETPLMCYTSVTDPFIQSIPVHFEANPRENEQLYYLQTSPEYAMKRLLAAGSGPIFQITKVFRQGEVGRFHNPEFTMLEWYRPDVDHHQLMDEMDELLQCILHTAFAERKSYADLFQAFLQIDPHNASLAALKACAKANKLDVIMEMSDRDTWLNLLMSHLIEPHLGERSPFFVYDFPASQAALARIRDGNPPLASRFEVYYKGIELANGFHELQNVSEHRKRFAANLKTRQTLSLPTLAIDEFFLAALEQGLPDCAGVALGIDRLVMLATGQDCIADVLSFDFSRV